MLFPNPVGEPAELRLKLAAESPLRASLFGPEQLARHAVLLSQEHDDPALSPHGPERLLPRLEENQQLIRKAYRLSAQAIARRRPISPAVEWLLDNYHIIEEHILLTRRHLPKGFSRKLPRLQSGPYKGWPRVYDLAVELISHTDARIDTGNLALYVQAYQQARPLKLGELWAIPIMLRMALIENLRRLSQRIIFRRHERDAAIDWAERFQKIASQGSGAVITALAELVESHRALSYPFIVELMMRLEGHHALGMVQSWLEQELTTSGQSLEQALQIERQDQAAAQASIGNTITSLRLLSQTDWPEFVESQSAIEQTLRQDPAGIYPQMDFHTRDDYRSVIERLATRTGKEESLIAQLAVDMAQRMADKAGATPPPEESSEQEVSSDKDHASGEARPADCGPSALPAAASHVGEYLVGPRRHAFEKHVGYRPSWSLRTGRWLRRTAPFIYLLTLTLGVLGLTAGLLMNFAPGAAGRWSVMVLTAVLVLLMATRPIFSIINWLATLLVPPRGLPRMDFKHGIPDEHRTLVAVPTMLTHPRAIDELVRHLEIRYLANRDANLLFALVTDFTDADQATLPGDEALLDHAVQGVRRLNQRYADEDRPVFCLIHRERQWNACEGVWMGRERKRGKLGDLNRLILGHEVEDMAVHEGDLSLLRTVQYVITLDSDTQLPPQSAWRMVGVMAHPLNRPQVNPRTGCVISGYGVLQPRVAHSLRGATASWYARLHSGKVGFDPYTRQVSEVYHDIYAQTPFIGKGIYDVHAFEAAVGERFPDNAILSHDLIEGLHARCGFINDVELIEDYPASYLTDARRRHRWVRGDWQLLPWMLPRVRDAQDRRQRNPLDFLAHWKILDNLRRTLWPAGFWLLLCIAWLLLPGSPGVWTAALLGVYFLPWAVQSLFALLNKPLRVAWRYHLRYILSQQGMALAPDVLQLLLLPYEMCLNLDAIARALWRKHVSRCKLLEWQTASDAHRQVGRGLGAFLKTLWINPVMAILVGVLIYVADLPALDAAAPLLVAWLLGPVVIWFLSRPRRAVASPLTAEDVPMLRLLARQTWHYFEVHLNEADHWLIPDNVQEGSHPKVARRTSPTNLGMALVSALAARDFGYLSQPRLLDLLQAMLQSMNQLERYQGHFYNWYSTEDKKILPPHYVSTVDSGNLAGALITLRQGLLEMISRPAFTGEPFDGLHDTALALHQVVREHLGQQDIPSSQRESLDRLAAFCQDVSTLPRPRTSLHRMADVLNQWHARLMPLASMTTAVEPVDRWLAALREQVRDFREELLRTAPWLATPAPSWMADPQAQRHLDTLDASLTLQQLADLEDHLGDRSAASPVLGELASLPDGLTQLLKQVAGRARQRIELIQDLARLCESLGTMDLSFLLDRQKKLLAIGYDVSAHRRDEGVYDLLASEARVSSYIGIAQGQLPYEHWFLLSRQQAPSDHGMPILLSWSGSMFEYLMPNLIMPAYPDTLVYETCRGAVAAQMRHGRKHGTPWGVSESCYNLVDGLFNYQYRAFGVPGLGLKRGLADDLVIAPYASVMALMVRPREAVRNIRRMIGLGFNGTYGLVEAVDYTPQRLPVKQDHVLVETYMAHHSGMSLLSLAYALLGQPMQRRFMADPQMRSVLTLLEEHVPAALNESPTELQSELAESAARQTQGQQPPMRRFHSARSTLPDVHLLGNGQYNVILTTAGAGVSTWGDLAINHWMEDASRQNLGQFCYVQDVQSGHIWSTTHQPIGQPPAQYDVVFSQAIAEFHRLDDQVETSMRVAVSPEDDVEVRRVILSNLSSRPRKLDVTSYMEIALMPQTAYMAHRAFHNLFVQTELHPDHHALLATRRPRSADEAPPWMCHMMVVHDTAGQPVTGQVSFETDRSRFLGRGRSSARPRSMEFTGQLSNSQGSVLDPVAAIRRRVTLPPHESVVVDIITGAAANRQRVMDLIDKYQDHRLAERVFSLAWTHSQVLLQHLRMDEPTAQKFGKLATSIVFANRRHRSDSQIIARNRKDQSALWSYGISGDLPIMLVQISDRSGLSLVAQCLRAQTYYRHKHLLTDLVIWVDSGAGYRQSLRDEILAMVGSGPSASLVDQRGGVFVRTTEQIAEDDQLLLQAVARVYLSDRRGSFDEQIDGRDLPESRIAMLTPSREPEPAAYEPATSRDDLVFHNGVGGFTQDGKEYILTLAPQQRPPAPWANIIANPMLGTAVTESGGAYTWFLNAHEYRLTPWYNDPVSDTTGEAFYLRDEETGQYWSPTPGPVPARAPHTVRHGLGYSVFEHHRQHLRSEMTVFVAQDAPVKCVVIKITNTGQRQRRCSVAGYFEWALGEHRAPNAMHLTTRLDPSTGAILAHNPFRSEFAHCTAFVHCSEAGRSFTCDRSEFIGPTGSLSHPRALRRKRLSNRIGAGLDPCTAMMSTLDLAPGQTREVVFMLGAAQSADEARGHVQRLAGVAGTKQALQAVWQQWHERLSAVHLQTPDQAVNFLANHWLQYQCISCRLWGRSGFYQSGGALGFRDQLQDSMALLHTMPGMLREQLLINASRQFVQGDVQHWWHPPQGRGVRTHFSDDYLWLPLATARYVLGTGDTGVLDEQIPYLTDRPVGDDEESYYAKPYVSDEHGSLFDHCQRAIDRSLSRFGSLDLPLMGCGDWNDGMNRVGIGGKGQSVWLGFFLYQVLQDFAQVCEARQAHELAERYQQQAQRLVPALEAAWDGQWYRRAYFDDGTPLGSSQNPECRIDLLPQSWAILTGATQPQRARQAMEQVDQQLVRRDAGLIQLFTPAFDDAPWDPGYIKGYVPGVRENGGQYTHAAIWAVMAFAQMRDVRRAWELMDLINPIRHGDTAERMNRYKVEPYVVAADVYSNPDHLGRGGWTWYTGSAGWMYRLIVESLLGVQRRVDRLHINPVVPQSWGSFDVYHRFGQSHYHINVKIKGPRTWEVQRILVDGQEQPGESIALIDDGRERQVTVEVG